MKKHNLIEALEKDKAFKFSAPDPKKYKSILDSVSKAWDVSYNLENLITSYVIIDNRSGSGEVRVSISR